MSKYTEYLNLGAIYQITVNSNYKYFGSTIKTFSVRKSQHLSGLKKNKHPNKILQNCYNKYGEEALIFEVIQDNIPADILEHIENIYIGANCSRAEDGKKGMNIIDAFRPRWSKEAKIKLSNKIKSLGIKPFRTKEQIEKRGKESRKKVYQYNLNGDFIKEWESHKEVYKHYSVKSGLDNCLNKNGISFLGFQWESKYKGFNIEPIRRKEGIKIKQIDENYKIIGEFNSMVEASEKTGIPLFVINNHIFRKTKNISLKYKCLFINYD